MCICVGGEGKRAQTLEFTVAELGLGPALQKLYSNWRALLAGASSLLVLALLLACRPTISMGFGSFSWDRRLPLHIVCKSFEAPRGGIRAPFPHS